MKQLPAQLTKLHALANNLHWVWDYPAVELFRTLDPILWESTNHNPIAIIDALGEERLAALAADPAFLAQLDRASGDLDAYLNDTDTWFATTGVAAPTPRIAYFSMEFGLHESLPIYSGGLGVLAGDHLKSASDLGVPLVALGLFYREGYFRQTLDDSGWQQDGGEDNAPEWLPVAPVNGPDGTPLIILVRLADHEIQIAAWQVRVGRITLYLLDTDLPANNEEDRRLTARLYGGDITMRIRQEIVLGIGGTRFLEAFGIAPRCLPHERGARRLPDAGAGPPHDGRGWQQLRGGAGEATLNLRLHHAYAGPGRARLLLARSDGTALRRVHPAFRTLDARVPQPRAAQPGTIIANTSA